MLSELMKKHRLKMPESLQKKIPVKLQKKPWRNNRKNLP